MKAFESKTVQKVNDDEYGNEYGDYGDEYG
jgi:hypothetical protein